MSEGKWLSVHSRDDLFGNLALDWHNSRNITAEDLQEMLDNDEPIPTDWYRSTDKGLEISESFDNILDAVRTIEYETDGKVDWCELAYSVIQDVAASCGPTAQGLGHPPFGNREHETLSEPTQKSSDCDNSEDAPTEEIRK
jgi:hypothetical protein